MVVWCFAKPRVDSVLGTPAPDSPSQLVALQKIVVLRIPQARFTSSFVKTVFSQPGFRASGGNFTSVPARSCSSGLR
jgi:hypothetical protein